MCDFSSNIHKAEAGIQASYRADKSTQWKPTLKEKIFPVNQSPPSTPAVKGSFKGGGYNALERQPYTIYSYEGQGTHNAIKN